MQIGLQLPRFPTENTSEIMKTTAKMAEDAGFYSIWVMDHHFQIPNVGDVTTPMHEGYSMLNYLAGVTNRVKLGTMVTGVIYRYPGILVKTVTTLDHTSNGRAYFGVGAAWFEREAKGLGIPFPPLKERFEHLEDLLQIAHQMWSDNNGEFNGKHHHLAETLCVPQPVQKPHPPILIGGMGENKTFRLIAKYANATNMFARGVGKDSIDLLKHKLSVLEKRCNEINRPFSEIEKTTLGTIHLAEGKQTPSEAIDYFTKLHEIGIQHAIVNMPNTYDLTPFEAFKNEIIPAVSDL